MRQELGNKILIVGLGLIGGSYAQGLKSKGYYVAAISNNPDDLKYAIEHHIIDEGTTEVTKEYLEKFHLIIFALYPKVFVEWIHTYGNMIADDTIITDVTGIKSAIVDQINQALRPSIEFIPAHPMAGKEVSGVQNADYNIFKSANYIITPTSNNTKKGLDVARAIGEELEFNHISLLSPQEHDQMIAFLSQLTHCIAVSLMCSQASEHLVEYTGDSFRDLTRIARINENMWSELFIMNKNELLSQIDLFLKQFVDLRNAIQDENIEKIKEMMILSTERRSYFDK